MRPKKERDGFNSRKGAIAELQVCEWLLRQGFEVFRNVSPCGPVDLVAWRISDDRLFKIDVKSITFATTNLNGKVRIPTVKVRRDDIHIVLVMDGAVVGFCRRLPGGGGEIYDPLSP